MLTVLTQKPPFSTGNLRLLTLAATLEAALLRWSKGDADDVEIVDYHSRPQ
jgi:hypothetical protein